MPPPVDPGVGLVGFPAELVRVEPVEVDPVLGRLALAVQRAADLHVAVRGSMLAKLYFALILTG